MHFFCLVFSQAWPNSRPGLYACPIAASFQKAGLACMFALWHSVAWSFCAVCEYHGRQELTPLSGWLISSCVRGAAERGFPWGTSQNAQNACLWLVFRLFLEKPAPCSLHEGQSAALGGVLADANEPLKYSNRRPCHVSSPPRGCGRRSTITSTSSCFAESCVCESTLGTVLYGRAVKGNRLPARASYCSD